MCLDEVDQPIGTGVMGRYGFWSLQLGLDDLGQLLAQLHSEVHTVGQVYSSVSHTTPVRANTTRQ